MSKDSLPRTCRIDPETELIEGLLPTSNANAVDEAVRDDSELELNPEELELAKASLGDFHHEAMQIPKEDVQHYRGLATRVLHNVHLAWLALTSQMDRLRLELPYLEHNRLERAYSLSLALLYAAAAAAREVMVPRTLRPKRTEVYRLRRMMMFSLQAFAEKGMATEEEIAEIRAGSGFTDAVEDLAALVQIFESRWDEYHNKTPVDIVDLARSKALIVELAPHLATGTTAADKGTKPPKADLRDRLWTLLLADYELMLKAGTYLYGQKVAAYIPPLLAVPQGKSKSAGGKGGVAQEGETFEVSGDEAEEGNG